MSKEIETSVNEFLANNGISYNVALEGATKRDDWECDQWTVKFSKAGKVISESFYTGTGHRQWDKIGKVCAAEFKGSKKSIYYNDLEKQYKKPVAPSAASVLYSLLSDAAAIDTSFIYWAEEFGYDVDSRKALATYEACCNIGLKLKDVFTIADRNALREMLQDY